METALIGGFTAIVIAILSASLGYYWTKKREQAAELRKAKLELYQNFLSAYSAARTDPSHEEKRELLIKEANAMYLIASPSVIIAWQNYKQAVKENSCETQQKENLFFYEVREDLGTNAKAKYSSFKVEMSTY
ncbi:MULTISPECIES: hypothetical protein [Deefgea]|uniref:Uncharacterized protein n=1 Tax=Deefgea salmonis TaxID=2875502 RepID=A0ABS8BNA9_9NEIS|nr:MULTISPECIES: hypothetical protein [Deefgea]MCB5197201.1 hypothetical protein [Deefgea salmonis]QZA80972.1 hypothetical protein K4H25_16055 [Deefgea piscis]